MNPIRHTHKPLDVGKPIVFGKHLILDLDGCDADKIGQSAPIDRFARELVALIKMTPYGDPWLEHFGHDDPVTSGWTLVQLIETSSIVGHFSTMLRRAHLDVFSCREFDTPAVIAYSAEYFDATAVTETVLYR